MAAQQIKPDDILCSLCHHRDDPKADADPYSYCFETNDNDDCSMAKEHGRLVVMFLKDCDLLEEVEAKLNSRKGRYSRLDAQGVLTRVMEHIFENGNDKYFTKDPREEGFWGGHFIWAVGVLAYYLLCGYPLLETRKQIETYDAIGLGPKFESEAWKELQRTGHRFPSKQWRRLEKDARQSIKKWSHYNCHQRSDLEGLFSEALRISDTYEGFLFHRAFVHCDIFDDSSDEEVSMRAIVDRHDNDLKIARKKRARTQDPLRETNVKKWNIFMDKARAQSMKKERKIYGDLHGNRRNESVNGGPGKIEKNDGN